jgi:hypothetical protein
MTKQEFLRDLKGLLPEGVDLEGIIEQEALNYFYSHVVYIFEFLDFGQLQSIKDKMKDNALEDLELFKSVLPEALQEKLEEGLLDPQSIISQLEKY